MKHRLLLVFLFSSLCSLCLCGESSAALDPGAKTPYQLTVVLHFADHRLLTDAFRDRVERELRDGLQASFGALVNVDVTREHSNLAEVLQTGLRSLDGWHERGPTKTHFVLIDYAGAQYEIQARQYDGATGLASPVVRRDRTPDREFVPKAAALLVEQDFGLAGVFDSWPAANDATPGEDHPVALSLQGAGLGVPLDRWIKKGDVFSVVAMPPGDAAPGRSVLGALLVVDSPPTERDASCVCRVFRRFDRPSGAGAGGYRCVKLGTVTAPLRLRLFQALPDGGTGPLKDTLRVQVRRHGFSDDAGMIAKEAEDDAVDTTGDKGGPFENVAFVSVYAGGDRPKARIPLPLLDEQPVVLAVNVAKDDDTLHAFKVRDWEADVTAAWQAQNQLFREVSDWAGKPEKRAEAMKAIQDGVKRSRDDFDRLIHERQELDKVAKLNSPAAEEYLHQLDKGTTELKEFFDKLAKIAAEENDPQKRKWLAEAEEGKRLEADLEIDKALAVYRQAIADGDADPNLKDYVDKLTNQWKPKSEAHRKARAFVYEVWPTLDDAGLKTNLDEAKSAVEVCKEAKDLITLRKFRKATDAQAARMKQELAELRPDINIEDEKQAKIIKDVTDAVTPIYRDADGFIKTAAPDK
jgi:hypothetical protein